MTDLGLSSWSSKWLTGWKKMGPLIMNCGLVWTRKSAAVQWENHSHFGEPRTNLGFSLWFVWRKTNYKSTFWCNAKPNYIAAAPGPEEQKNKMAKIFSPCSSTLAKIWLIVMCKLGQVWKGKWDNGMKFVLDGRRVEVILQCIVHEIFMYVHFDKTDSRGKQFDMP